MTIQSNQVDRDMGINHRDFLRILPNAIDNRPYTINNSEINIDDKGREILIRLGAEKEHRIASICLPRTMVSLTFFNHTHNEIEQFMRRFDIYYQRGGG